MCVISVVTLALAKRQKVNWGWCEVLWGQGPLPPEESLLIREHSSTSDGPQRTEEQQGGGHRKEGNASGREEAEATHRVLC